jgi:hypothetical protein
MIASRSTQHRNQTWLLAHVEHCVRGGAPIDWAQSIYAEGDVIYQAVNVRTGPDGRVLRHLRLMLGHGDIQSGEFKPSRQVIELPIDCVATPAPAPQALMSHLAGQKAFSSSETASPPQTGVAHD